MFPRRMINEKERNSDRNKSLIERAAYQVHVSMSRAINYERLYRDMQMAKKRALHSEYTGTTKAAIRRASCRSRFRTVLKEISPSTCTSSCIGFRLHLEKLLFSLRQEPEGSRSLPLPSLVSGYSGPSAGQDENATVDSRGWFA